MPRNHPSTRRSFLHTAVYGGVAFSALSLSPSSTVDRLIGAPLSKFKVGLISDEVSNDLEVALKFLQSFNLQWAELRNLWTHYVTEAPPEEITRAKKLLAQYNMRVSAIDTAFFKTLLPGTKSQFNTDPHSQRTPTFEEQTELLRRAIDRAKAFGTRYLRIFSFFRVDDPNIVFDQVVENLKKAVKIAEQHNVVLLLENEHTCNIGTGREAARALDAVRSPYLGLNWDPGNAFMLGEKPYPDGYNLLPKKRLLHMHLKDAVLNPETGKKEWMPVGRGQIDFLGQFRALLKDGFTGSMSLETHYKNKADDKVESSRESMNGIIETIRKA